jgi:hypothetical protein
METLQIFGRIHFGCDSMGIIFLPSREMDQCIPPPLTPKVSSIANPLKGKHLAGARTILLGE